jgi:hypothetical protein
MKIVHKTLMLTIEHDVQVGHNGAIEATLVHQAFVYRSEKTGNVECELDFADTINVKFMGMPIEEGYTGFKKFKESMLGMSIDVDKIFDEKAKQLITDEEMEKIKDMYTFIN